jgi:hypothetical protein
MRKEYEILFRNSGRKRSLTHRKEGYFNIDLREIVMEVVHWIHVAQVRDR